jgi:hypothetical protein
MPPPLPVAPVNSSIAAQHTKVKQAAFHADIITQAVISYRDATTLASCTWKQ